MSGARTEVREREGLGPMAAPLGALYAAAMAARRRAYAKGTLKSRALDTVVVSVGSIAAGGSMKTPVVRTLVEALVGRGMKVGVIGHGYRRQGGASAVVIASNAERILSTVEESGDEAIELARALPGTAVAVGPSKWDVGRTLEALVQPSVLVVDGGFQHRALKRDLDIACVSERDLSGRPIPAGLLRETPDALDEADLLFVDRDGAGPLVDELRRRRGEACLWMERSNFSFRTPDGRPAETPARAFALAGIARPERFAADLERLGVTIAGRSFFGDHHAFTPRELDGVRESARRANADAVVTTSKDATRVAAWPCETPLVVLDARARVEGLDGVLARTVELVARRKAPAERA